MACYNLKKKIFLDFISLTNNDQDTDDLPEVNEMLRDILFTSCFNE